MMEQEQSHGTVAAIIDERGFEAVIVMAWMLLLYL